MTDTSAVGTSTGTSVTDDADLTYDQAVEEGKRVAKRFTDAEKRLAQLVNLVGGDRMGIFADDIGIRKTPLFHAYKKHILQRKGALAVRRRDDVKRGAAA